MTFGSLSSTANSASAGGQLLHPCEVKSSTKTTASIIIINLLLLHRDRSEIHRDGCFIPDAFGGRAQELRDAPRLGKAAARCKRSIAIGDLRHLPHAGLAQMPLKPVQ